MPRPYDVLVVGGGAIGMATAWRLAQTGRTVLLVDQGRLGGEASSAAAGMLGAQLEAHEPGPFFRLCLESRSRYPAFAAELLEETGIDIQWVQNGILQVAPDEARAQVLRDRAAWQEAAGARTAWWTADDIRAREPLVSPGAGGLFLPDDGNVSAAHLTQALAVAVRQRADVREGAVVTRIEPTGGRVRVTTIDAVYEAERAVIAAGAWAGPLLAQVGVATAIRPVKGQLFALRPRGGGRLVRTVSAPGIYLVPKRDGTIVAGATEEHGAGFNRDVTADGLLQLLTALARVAPGLTDAQFVRAWTGLRPGSPGGEPLIGPAPEYPQVIVCAGHFRNGILLAPLTAQMVLAWVEGQALPDDWLAFAPRCAEGERDAARRETAGATDAKPAADATRRR
ncbi:glycine oxidase ThiO [Alicyclobacillus cellulosilyticus]|uniref:glycine oxidase n=1 Tax=Alicyclobacillus cellulosilyticus TaxID=1003997 RepID=A0A917K8L9_9BACL|nr:glycine oxidase ThiO [Alicyclobacillus cellulosilyticus]GGJ01692.1 glycine oxidase ThiO [Alicyclobacillus cellulosilyticus]